MVQALDGAMYLGGRRSPRLRIKKLWRGLRSHSSFGERKAAPRPKLMREGRHVHLRSATIARSVRFMIGA